MAWVLKHCKLSLHHNYGLLFQVSIKLSRDFDYIPGVPKKVHKFKVTNLCTENG